MSQTPSKILTVFSKADVTHRAMLEGILTYVREHHRGDWLVQLDLRDIYRRDTAELADGNFSGIIAAVGDAADRRRYFATGLPTVLFEPLLARPSREKRPANSATFFNDHEAEGRAAAEYYLGRGYRTFAYVGTLGPTAWSLARERGFRARLRTAGFGLAAYRPPPAGGRDLTDELPFLAKWLRQLPAQTAVFAAHDERALQVLSAANRARLKVPDDLSLLGVDNDELLCSTSSPTLSSIPVNAVETGARIAGTMDAILAGRPFEPIVRTCHTRIVARLSTDAYASSDAIVARAVDYAGRHLALPLGIDDLAKAVHCSRRTLENRMKAELGLSPAEELAVLRRMEAVKLLRETRLSVAEIACRCGFCSSSHLATQIRRQTGRPPLALRRAEARLSLQRPETRSPRVRQRSP